MRPHTTRAAPVVALRRSGDGESEDLRRVSHPGVVGDQCIQSASEGARGGEMDGVKGSKDAAVHLGRGVQQRVVHSQEVHRGEETATSRNSVSTVVLDGPRDLDPSQRARYAYGIAIEEMPQRGRFGFGHDELHKSG